MFALVAKLNTIRVRLSLTTNLDWPLEQLNVKNAFLNGNLEGEVYMTIPPSFYKEREGNLVCKLKQTLYGLKQSPRHWFERFTKVIKDQGYKERHSDHTMFLNERWGANNTHYVC